MRIKLNLEIDSEDNAFQDGFHYEELTNILEDVVKRLRLQPSPMNQTLMDSNGNTVGHITLKEIK